MKALTQSERSDLERLLDKKLQARKNELMANDPGWQERVEDRKKKAALGKLRIEKDVVELKELDKQIAALEEKKKVIDKRMRSKLPLKKKDKYGDTVSCPIPMDLCEAMTFVCGELHRTEMIKDPTGKLILQAEADHLAAQTDLARVCSREDVVNVSYLN